MKNKLAKLALFIGLITGGGYIALSPWVMTYNLMSAVEDEDYERMKKMIDFPAVREDLKEATTKSIFNKKSSEITNPFARFGNSLLNFTAGAAIDQTITPEYLVTVIGVAAGIQGIGDDAGYGANYTGINNFELSVVNPNKPDSPIILFMERRGVSEWVVNRIDLSLTELIGR